MNINTLIHGGWAGFIAVLLAAAGIITSLILGRHEPRHTGGGVKPIGSTPLLVIWVVWTTLRIAAPDNWLLLTPIALVSPAVDLALFGAVFAVLVRALSQSFNPKWTWRTGFQQLPFFLMPAVSFSLIYESWKVIPWGWWAVAGVEAALLLPFFIRLGYDERQVIS